MKKLLVIISFICIFLCSSCDIEYAPTSKEYQIDENELYIEFTDPRVYPDNVIPGISYANYYLFDQTVDYYKMVNNHYVIMGDISRGISFLDKLMMRRVVRGYKWCIFENGSVLVHILKYEDLSQTDEEDIYIDSQNYVNSFNGQYLLKKGKDYCFIYISDAIDTLIKYDEYIFSGINAYGYIEHHKGK